LFYGYLSLREHDAFLDEKDDLALMSNFPLDDFASTLEREACEARSLLNRLADMLAQDAIKDLQRNGLQEPNVSQDNDDKQSSLVKSQNLLKQFGLISDNRPIFVQVQERHSTSPICFNLSTSLYSSPIDIVANVILSKLSASNPTMINEERMKIVKEYKTRYWLQAFGCEERLFGTKPLIQSRYVQTCLRLDKPLYFKLINIESAIGNGKKRCMVMIHEAIKQEEERKKPQKFGGRSNEVRQVWNEKDIACRYFSLRILSGQLIPAGEFDEVKIIIGLYHGTQPLFSGSIMESRSVDTLNPDWQQEIKFDITLVNLPPASKLCCSIHFHRRRTSILNSIYRCVLKSAIDLFTRSCAGYCVITYVLGVADRHPDNIMVNKRGQLFHIDFGHILGNFKMKYGIRRERTQLVLIDDFVRVITNNNTEKNPIETREFKNFKKLCIKGYRILRRQYRQIVCLFKLMMNCDLTELNSEADMAYLRQTFAIDIGANEQEACDRFEQVLLDSYRSSLKTRFDWFFHALNHIKS
ncbi:unnamed protein product, partial [Rotaria sp. Silwood1]